MVDGRVSTPLDNLVFDCVVVTVTCTSSQFCSRSYVNGRWTSHGNCEDGTSLETIMGDLKRRAEKERVEVTQSGGSKQSGAETRSFIETPTTKSNNDVTTSKPYDNDGVNTSNSKTAQASERSTTATEDGIRTSKPKDERSYNTSHFLFPSKEHLDYVQYEGVVPEMKSFTACVWVRPAPDKEPVAGTLLSYCALTGISSYTECKAVHVKIGRTAIKVHFESGYQFTAMDTSITTRSHLCIMKTPSSTATYVNGSILPSTTVQNSDPIPGNGVLILGQSQHGPISGTSPGKQRFQDEGFHGEIEGFTIWARALNGTQILGMYESDGCYCPSDAVVTFDRNNSIVSSHGATYTWTDACDKNE